MPYIYARLQHQDDGSIRVVKEHGPYDEPLATEPTIILPEERKEVETIYHDGHGRQAPLKGWVVLPALLKPAEVKRGPDGLPLERPLREEGKPEKPLADWQILQGPEYIITDAEVIKRWTVVDVDLTAWKERQVENVRTATRERINALVSPLDMLAALRAGQAPEAIDTHAVTLQGLQDEALASIDKAVDHGRVAETMLGAVTLIRRVGYPEPAPEQEVSR